MYPICQESHTVQIIINHWWSIGTNSTLDYFIHTKRRRNDENHSNDRETTTTRTRSKIFGIGAPMTCKITSTVRFLIFVVDPEFSNSVFMHLNQLLKHRMIHENYGQVNLRITTTTTTTVLFFFFSLQKSPRRLIHKNTLKIVFLPAPFVVGVFRRLKNIFIYNLSWEY